MNIKSLFTALIASIVLASCTLVTPQITTTIYWRGKPVEDFFDRYRMPDIELTCMKDNVRRYIYAYKTRLFEYRDTEVGRDANTIYMQRDKVYSGVKWTIVFADERKKITSVGNFEWENLKEHYGCDEYAEEDTRFSEADMARRTVKPRVWKAYSMDDASDSTKVYESSTKKTEEEAKADAIAKCKRAGGKNCVAWEWFSNMCLGTAVGQKGGQERSYLGRSLDDEHADYMALRSCTKNATQCRTFHKASCALPCDLLTDKKCMIDPPQMGIYKTMPTSTVEFDK